MRKKNIPEFKKNNSDAIAAEMEYERVIAILCSVSVDIASVFFLLGF